MAGAVEVNVTFYLVETFIKLEFFITVFCPFHLEDDLFFKSFSSESEFYACSTYSKPNLNF